MSMMPKGVSHDDIWKLDPFIRPTGHRLGLTKSPGRAVPCSAVCRIEATRTL
jgi:hypothetical protein